MVLVDSKGGSGTVDLNRGRLVLFMPDVSVVFLSCVCVC